MSFPAITVAPWTTFHVRWSRMGPPQRPDAAVCGAMRASLEGHRARVLLLGVTPELASIGVQTVAVDWSPTATTHIWPGTLPGRAAMRANWLDLPFEAAAFSGVAGDGSLNCLEFPRDYDRLFAQLARVVRPGGSVAIRAYTRPDRCEPVTTTCARATAGDIGSVHALKWLIAHALCDGRATTNLPARDILDAFNRGLPDRAALADATGWSLDDIAQIDAYASLPDVFSFPTREAVLAIVPPAFAQVRFVDVGSYELADRCPILLLDRR
jgi:SAM-dependent methyltransferase